MRRAQHRAGRRTSAAAWLVLAGTLVLGGCGSYPGVTKQSTDAHHLYDVMFVIATVIFLLVEGLIVWAVLRYRRRDDQLPPQFHGNNVLEVGWTLGPLLIVAALFWFSWQAQHRVEAETKNPDVTVNVLGFQWQWQFTFQGEKVAVEEGKPPQDLTLKGTIARPPEIYLPVGRTIHFNLQSRDVIHSFYVPEFLFKRDAIPGHPNHFEVTIDKPGSYRGQCAEFCGLAHNGMHFNIKAVPEAQYRQWIAQQKKAAASGCPNDPTPGQISAQNIAFDKDCLAAKAGQPFTLKFDNKDAGVSHNVAVFRNESASGGALFTGAIFAGPQTQTYDIKALPKGNYFFRCDVHAQAMTGKLVVR
ncbi:MAG TPA: cytochrome c oxidase subunit II [Actinomycetes bacterium]